jgi:rhodanese-related sulfurtransferase
VTGIDQLLAQARAGLSRLEPHHALDALRRGGFLVDTRPEFQRRADGEIPGAIVIERVHLEWRLDPTSAARIPQAVGHDIEWIVLCDEGYSSSLAAASLRTLGLHKATDVIGGFRAWRAAGLPVTRTASDTRYQSASTARTRSVPAAPQAEAGDRRMGSRRLGRRQWMIPVGPGRPSSHTLLQPSWPCLWVAPGARWWAWTNVRRWAGGTPST